MVLELLVVGEECWPRLKADTWCPGMLAGNMADISDLLLGCTRPRASRLMARRVRSLWLSLSCVGGDSEVGGLSV